MDQIKKQLEVVLQYGFWIGASIVLFGSVAVWYLSTSELSKQSASQMTKIKSDANTISNLRMEIDTQPNDKSHEQMEEMIGTREKEVLDAWNSIYQDQRGILTWPTDDQIPKEFIDVFRYPKNKETGELDRTREMLPYELYVDFPITDEQKVPQRILRTYERYIGKVLPDMAKIANTEWTADFEAKASVSDGGFEGFDAMPAERSSISITGQDEGPVVKWSRTSQEEVLADLFPWRGVRPNTLDVYYSQENLWILKQLLEIVAKVNGDASQHFEAKIREIKKLSIGKSVNFGAGSLAEPGIDGGGGEMYSDMDDMMGSDMDSTGMSLGNEVQVDPADDRYINMENKPIKGSALRSSLKSKSPQDAPLAVAKRVPVMLSLQMDQRFLPLLLAECGSAPLMVEVRQVRVLPKGKTGSAESAMDMGGEMDEMEEGIGGGGGAGGYGATAAKKSQPQDEFPLDVTVEVYGLINIYNPPDKAALGVDQITQDTVIDGAKIGQPKPPTTSESALPPPTPVAPPAPEPAAPEPAAPEPAAPEPAAPEPAAPAPAAPAPADADTNPTGPGTATPAPGTTTPAAAAPAGT